MIFAVLAVTGMLDVALMRTSADAPHSALWFTLPAIAVLVLPLFARRRFPFGAPAAYWVIAASVSFVDGRLVPFAESIFILGMAASFLLGNARDTLQAKVGVAIAVGCAAIVVSNLPGRAAGDLLFIPLLFGLCCLGGFAVRDRAERAEAAELRAAQAERERDTTARIAVAEERTRIARELHDIVAHAVSVMVLHAGAVRHRLPEALADDREALRTVEDAGRAALAEMRRLLAGMRSDGDGDDVELGPQPGLDRLEVLLEEMNRAGLPVRLHVDGEPYPLPGAIGLSAYRIVQEGLTNALKHAGASQVDVTVRYQPDELQLEVQDNGRGGPGGDGTGHGLVGIRERVKIYGGEMEVGPRAGGGFLLSTRLPLDVRRP